MTKLPFFFHLGALLVASCFCPGCAPAYHAYPNGCVSYGYRQQPPLPFSFYRGCPTPWLLRHAARIEGETGETRSRGNSRTR